MKIVVDTNVFISGVFFTGPPHQILNAWRRGSVQIVVTPEILTEYPGYKRLKVLTPRSFADQYL